MRKLTMIATIVVLGVSGAQARKPAPPTGELLLDMGDPVITARLNGVALRLRVGLEQKDVIELNPDVAARLPAKFEPSFPAEVGRETLSGIAAPVQASIEGRKFLALAASHGRPCCAGVDGAIGVMLLPYATVRFRRAGEGGDGATLSFPMSTNSSRGLEAEKPVGKSSVFLQFSFERPETVATASAGAILAQAYAGEREPGSATTMVAFGVERPVQSVRFARVFTLAGFAFDRLITRTADFGGRHEFPRPAGQPDDIVVNRRIARQEAWPVVVIGRDRLDRCGEALFDTRSRLLTLRCDFAGAPPP